MRLSVKDWVNRGMIPQFAGCLHGESRYFYASLVQAIRDGEKWKR